MRPPRKVPAVSTTAWAAYDTAEVGPNALDALLLPFSFHFEAGHHRFTERQVGRVLQQLQHLAGVQPFIGLGA
jgi:hypothetical protein